MSGVRLAKAYNILCVEGVVANILYSFRRAFARP